MTRNVTIDASNTDKTTMANGDKFMIIDTETEPDALKEITKSNLFLNPVLVEPVLTTPTIGDFTSAQHDHGDADDGGAVVSSSATVAGVVELATNAETLIGTDTARAVTPDDLEYARALSGWTPDTNTWSYSSADDPTFIISVNADMTAKIGVGDRIKLTQTSAKYFIVTAVGAFGGGATLITVYGGTDYDLANAAISSPFYSHAKAPLGFPADPDKWTVVTADTSNASQATPAAGTWYNVGTITIAIPIGCWRAYYECVGEVVTTLGAAAVVGFRTTLSTANNSESDTGFTARKTSALPAMTGATDRFSVHREKILNLASKTTYYLNISTGAASTTSISIRGDDAPTAIRCVCAYL